MSIKQDDEEVIDVVDRFFAVANDVEFVANAEGSLLMM